VLAIPGFFPLTFNYQNLDNQQNGPMFPPAPNNDPLLAQNGNGAPQNNGRHPPANPPPQMGGVQP